MGLSSQISILGKKKGVHPKLGKNSTNLDLAQTFRVTSGQQKIVIGGEPPPLSQNSISGKKEGGPLQIRQKFNQLGFCSNLQGYDNGENLLYLLSQNLTSGKLGQNYSNSYLDKR